MTYIELCEPTGNARLYPGLDNGSLVCWSRMQTEAGQKLGGILRRKELERSSGSGIFFWGVGNAPSRSIAQLAKSGRRVDVIFSVMKSRPKARDVRPSAINIWNKYLDLSGVVQDIPDHVLITSRAVEGEQSVRTHYALMCYSSAPLLIADHGCFYPDDFRNFGETGGKIGASQVTVLLQKVSAHNIDRGYQVNLRASLTGSYWVKLLEPTKVGIGKHDLLMDYVNMPGPISTVEWRERVSEFRAEFGHVEKHATSLQLI